MIIGELRTSTSRKMNESNNLAVLVKVLRVKKKKVIYKICAWLLVPYLCKSDHAKKKLLCRFIGISTIVMAMLCGEKM